MRIPLAATDVKDNFSTTMDGVYDPDANARAEELLKTKQTEGVTPVLVIPAAGFTADGSDPDSSYFPVGGGYFQGTGENYGCMVAPVYLPNGVIIRQIFASVYDNDASWSVVLNLRRVNNYDGAPLSLGSAQTSIPGAFAGIEIINDSSIESRFVDQPDYSYYLTTCLLSGSMRFYSARIDYEFPLFYDGFEIGATNAWANTNP